MESHPYCLRGGAFQFQHFQSERSLFFLFENANKKNYLIFTSSFAGVLIVQVTSQSPFPWTPEGQLNPL